MSRLWIKIGLVVIVVVWVSSLFTSRALAHAYLLRSDPADNALLAEAPRQMRLWFNEPISPQFSSAQMLDIDGTALDLLRIEVDADEPGLMILELPELSEGVFSVRWKVLSEADGHFTQGLLVFGVGEAGDLGQNAFQAAAGKDIEAPSVLPLPEVGLRWANFSVLSGLVGALAVVYLILAPIGAGSAGSLPADTIAMARRAAQRRILYWAIWCGVAGLIIGVALLFWQVATLMKSLPEGASMPNVAWQVIGATRWGYLWLARQGILLLLSAVVYCLWRVAQDDTTIGPTSTLSLSLISKYLPLPSAYSLLPTPYSLLPTPLKRLLNHSFSAVMAGLLSLALLAVQALTGHAAAVTPHTALAIVADWLHLLAASLWVGGLWALNVGFLPLVRRHAAVAQHKSDLAALVRAGWAPFSRMAALSVGLIIATGLYSMGRQVTSVDALLTSLYGQALLVKIGLVLAVGGLGLLNSILLHPRLAKPIARLLRKPAGWTPLSFSLRHLPRLVVAEVGLGLLILLTVGLITASSPARGPAFEADAGEIPNTVSQSVDDVLITFSAKPNRPGQNIFTVRAVSTRRPAPAEILKVIVRFRFIEQEFGLVSAEAEEIEPGLYQLGGNHLKLAGRWQIDVVVRRKGLEDSVAHFEWRVPKSEASPPVIVSNRRWEPMLTLAAAIMMILIVIFIGSLGFRRFQT